MCSNVIVLTKLIFIRIAGLDGFKPCPIYTIQTINSTGCYKNHPCEVNNYVVRQPYVWPTEMIYMCFNLDSLVVSLIRPVNYLSKH